MDKNWTARQGWNNGWEFTTEYTEGFAQGDACPGAQEVRLPHTVKQTPYNYFGPEEYEMVSGYRRRFTAPAEWARKTLLLHFGAAAHEATVLLNGSEVATHSGGYTAFTVNLTGFVRPGEENLLAVKLDSREALNLPPFGNVIDYLTYGGLYREVRLEIKNSVWIADVFAKPQPTPGKGSARLSCDIRLEGEVEGLQIKQALLELDGAAWGTAAAPLCSTEAALEGIELWSPDSPALYTLRTVLERDGEVLDAHETRIGFRTAEFKQDGFYLNGQRLKLRGLNRHQSWPYVGYAMPARAQRFDAAIAKQELGLNAVRTSHYPQSQYFIDACDELGLLVFTELPGWQHIGDAAWKEVAKQSLREMVTQYRNHPSIVLWGVRINESTDDDAFYTDTNAIAHELDATRQTSGVRYLKKSSFLEDVYAYNDFVHTGKNQPLDEKATVTPDESKPYLVSEFNGHMFPTKSYDDEARRLEHALRHARVVNAYYGAGGTAGGFGWCMFDYNTHQDFGSGDGICHHGVLDMFRGPKLAAAVYASQQDERPVLEISSSMDIGEYPGGNLGEIYAFTNADSVKLYKNEVFVKEFYPDRDTFPHLPHPPVKIDDLVGGLLAEGEGLSPAQAESVKQVLFAVRRYGQNSLPLSVKLQMGRMMLRNKWSMEYAVGLYMRYIGNWGGKATVYRFEAVQSGEVVATVEKGPKTKVFLRCEADTTALVEGSTYDAATVRITARDEKGSLLPYYNEPVCLAATGPLEILGPQVISLKGGSGGTYLRTTGRAGEGSLRVTSQTDEHILQFTISLEE